MHKFHICVNIVCLALLWTGCRQAGGSSDSQLSATISKKTDTASVSGTINLKDSLPVTPESDTARYRKLIHYLAHDSVTSKWPKDYGHPPSGAILPFKRIVAYYGNFYSRHMGILVPVRKRSYRKSRQRGKCLEQGRQSPACNTCYTLHCCNSPKLPGQGQ